MKASILNELTIGPYRIFPGVMRNIIDCLPYRTTWNLRRLNGPAASTCYQQMRAVPLSITLFVHCWTKTSHLECNFRHIVSPRERPDNISLKLTTVFMTTTRKFSIPTSIFFYFMPSNYVGVSTFAASNLFEFLMCNEISNIFYFKVIVSILKANSKGQRLRAMCHHGNKRQ